MNTFRVIVMAMSFFFLGHLAEAQVGSNWTEVTSVAPWSPRDGFGAVAFNERMWVMGGPILQDVWSSLDGTNWTQVTSAAPWGYRDGFGAISFNGRMWVLGGYNGAFLKDVWSSPDGTNWTQATSAAPWGARPGFAAVVFNRQMWVLGGSGLNDVWSSSDGANWTQVTSAAPWSGRDDFGALVFNGKMWVLGGYNGNLLKDVWSSSDGTNWTQATPAAPWSGRDDFGAVTFNGRMWVLGGEGGSGNDVWSSSDGTNWTQVTAATPWSSRYAFGAVTFNGQMWVMGGYNNNSLDDVWSSPPLSRPVASFTAAPTNGFVPLSVSFTDMSTGFIDSWFWNFGDGGTTNVTTNTVLYTYNTPGVYSVTEIVSGPGGVSTNVQSNYIVVGCPTNTLPLAISVTPASLSETITQGQDAPSQSFGVWNSAASCSTSTLTYSISTNASWLSVSPTNGTSAGATNTHTVSYTTASLTTGLYNATITITSPDAANSPQNVPVSLNVVLPLVVSNTNDYGPGSLAQAILNANEGVGETILFSNVTGTITLTGELLISTNVTILGPGPTNLAISGNGANRVFDISSNATASISGLTIQNGSTDGPGGAVYNLGNLVLSNCFVLGSSSRALGVFGYEGGIGGGIYNGGTMAMAYCIVTNNFAEPGYEIGPLGGGIYNAGVMTLDWCAISGNSCGTDSQNPDEIGSGGGIYNASTLTINSCTISINYAADGGTDAGSTGGDGGVGGGVYNDGTLTVIDSTANGNSSGSGADGVNFYSGGNGGDGGGFWNGGSLFMIGCTVSSNTCGSGGFGESYGGSVNASGGNGGSGGGIWSSGILAMTNCTIVGNNAGNGGAGNPGFGYAGANGGNGGNGGGISGGATLVNCTISGNVAGRAGAGGTGFPPYPSGTAGSAGSGGGIGGGGNLLNTLIASDSAPGSGSDVAGGFTSQGYNLIGNTSGSSGFGATGDLLNVNPLLGPLQNNGGPTFTCALLPGSPAIDAGISVGPPPYDQRGIARPQDAAFDIGAFEFVFVCPGDDLCDGIPDSWRAQYFPPGNGAATNDLSCATCDADGTGQNNLFKYLAGLDPTNPSSIFGITAITCETNDVLVTWTCVGGHSYVLQNTRSTAMIAGYTNNFADASPIIVASGTGPSTTNYLDVGAAYAPVVTPPGGTMVTTSTVPSTVDCSAVWTRGITDSLGNALPIGSVLMLGSFSISEPTIQSNFLAGNISAIMSNFTPYSTPFQVGDGTDQPASWDVSLSAAGFAGQHIYLLAVDAPSLSAANQLGIFTAPSWIFPADGSQTNIDLEDVTHFVIGAQGGSLTLNLVLGGETYTFNDTARLSVLPGRFLFYRVRLLP